MTDTRCPDCGQPTPHQCPVRRQEALRRAAIEAQRALIRMGRKTA